MAFFRPARVCIVPPAFCAVPSAPFCTMLDSAAIALPGLLPAGRASRHPRHRYDFALTAGDDAADVVSPHRDRGLHLALVSATVVHASDATAVAAVVVQQFFDNVRRDAEV